MSEAKKKNGPDKHVEKMKKNREVTKRSPLQKGYKEVTKVSLGWRVLPEAGCLSRLGYARTITKLTMVEVVGEAASPIQMQINGRSKKGHRANGAPIHVRLVSAKLGGVTVGV